MPRERDIQYGNRRPPPLWRSRTSLLVALLGLTFFLAAGLAYEAHDAARSHRATAERALHDYATFAAWELLAQAADSLRPGLTSALAPAVASKAATPYDVLPDPAILLPTTANVLPCANAADDAGRWVFRLDFRDGSFAVRGATPPARERELVRAAVSNDARTRYRPDWAVTTLLVGRRAAARTVSYGVKYAPQGAPIAAFGFVTCATALGAPLFAPVMARHPLLPRSLAGPASNDSLVSVSVLGPTGDTLWQSAEHARSPFTGDAATEIFDGLTARAALRPLAIERLALGALPSSKLGVLLGLLGLTAALMIVALLQLKREHELARLRSDFISSVSHELRTPLAQILLFAETLRLGRIRSAAERENAAEVIVEEGRRLMQLVDNVLVMSRIERGLSRLRPEPTVLAPCVREIVDTWRPLADAAGARLALALDEQATAVVDRGALRQMLLNLLDNALKYGPRGQTVTIEVRRDGRRVYLTVSDQGPGVPPGDRRRVWDAFHRLDRDVRSASAGSGIGLSVVRELAAQHGGETTLDDAPGGGARFTIALAAAAPVSTSERAEHPLTTSVP